jgi:hypothetical protein
LALCPRGILHGKNVSAGTSAVGIKRPVLFRACVAARARCIEANRTRVQNPALWVVQFSKTKSRLLDFDALLQDGDRVAWF